jgi:hypothetical protein
MAQAIRFNRHHVTNGIVKARIHYSLDNRVDGRKAVTLYAKDYSDKLAHVFTGDEYTNDTDMMTDYFAKGRVVMFEDHPLYAAARARAEAIRIARAEAR